MRKRIVHDICLIGLIVLSVQVGLHSTCRADETDEAREKFREGVELFSDKQYEPALRLFEASYGLMERPSTLFNIAMCHKALMQNEIALGHFREFLTQPMKATDPQMRADASAAIDELLLLVGIVELDGIRDGSEVRINERIIGTAPFGHELALNPGNYNLIISLNGHKTLSSEIQVTAGTRNRIWAKLSPRETTALPPKNEMQLEPLPREKESNPPPAPVDSGRSSLFKTGIVLGTAGIAAGLVGGYYSIMYLKHRSDGNEAKDRGDQYEDDNDEKDKEIYDQAQRQMDADTTGMILGYTIGATLFTAGLVMILMDKKRSDRPQRDGARMQLNTTGMTVVF